ncbi:YrhK family protein [Martelella sp. AMO21009]
MNSPIRTLVGEYGWIHLSLGLLGNIGFFVGSIFFLPSLEQYKTLGVWLFIVGSFFMLIGAVGRLLVDVTDKT